jgi:hypothetical protein
VLVFWPTLTAVSLYGAAVASLKFPLLYALGRVLGGARLGLCFAVAACLPSIAIYQWWVFFPPNWVEAAIAAGLLLGALAWRRRSPGFAFAAALALGLATQMHPTALFYAPVLPLLLAAIGLRGVRWLLHAILAAAAIAVWFAPLAFDIDSQPAAGLAAGAERVGTALHAFKFEDVGRVLRAAYVEIPLAIGETYARFLGWGWIAALAIVWSAVLAGALVAIAQRRRFAWLAGLGLGLAAGWVAITAMREYTSFYLAYFLLPLSAIVIGLALDALVQSPERAARGFGSAALAIAVGLAAAASLGAHHVASSGYVDTRLAALSDLKTRSATSIRAAQVGAATRDAFAAFACKRPELTLHGDLAFVLASSTGLDFRLQCPSGPAPRLALMGPDPPDPKRHWTTLPRAVADDLGRVAPVVHGGLALFNVRQVVHPPEGRPIEARWHYFEQLHDRRSPEKVVHDFEAAREEWLAIHRLKPFDSRWTPIAVECNGGAATPAFRTFNAEVYKPCDGDSRVRWRVAFETDAPQWVDVHTF